MAAVEADAASATPVAERPAEEAAEEQQDVGATTAAAVTTGEPTPTEEAAAVSAPPPTKTTDGAGNPPPSEKEQGEAPAETAPTAEAPAVTAATVPGEDAPGGEHPATVGAAAMDDGSPPLTVKFTVQPENFYFTQAFPASIVGAVCGTMYERIETMFRVPRQSMRLYWEGRPLAEPDIVGEVLAVPEREDEALHLELEFESTPEFLRGVNAGEQVLRSIEVPVTFGDDVPSKTIFVTITKAYDRKPFLGGYRNKQTESMYHHATTQTTLERETRRDHGTKFSRVTQTHGVTRSSQTRRECGTQMSRADVVVDTTFDRIVIAKPYFSAAELLKIQAAKAIKLQAFTRGWRARKLAASLREERDAEDAALRSEDERRRAEHQRKRDQEIQRRTHPRSAKDFAVLYNELEAWRLQETQRIHESTQLSEAERRVALQELLKKETKLLQTIDRLQIHANQENRVANVAKRLDTMASAKKWGVSRTVQVETPSTIRARELRDLYNGLLLSGLSIDERLDVLLHVKWTVKEFDCPLTRDIVELIDREADLLNRGRKDASLSALRHRTANLFLQFVNTPEFNPEALAHQTVPLEYMPRPHVQLSRK